MKDYETIKAELQRKTKNIKGFNKSFYKTFCQDLQIIQKELEKAEKENTTISITELWNKSATHETYFYKNNGCAYCLFLEIK